MVFDISFGGVALSTVAPDARILTWDADGQGLDAHALELWARSGTVFVRARRKNRTISFKLVLGATGYAARLAELQAICGWAAAVEPQTLTNTALAGWHLDAMCTRLPELLGNDPGAAVTLEFTAFDPDYIADSNTMAAAPGTITIGGTAHTYVNLTRVLSSAAADGLAFALGNDIITLDGSVPAGTVRIDSRLCKITHTDGGGNVTSLMSQLTYDSRFWCVAPGSHYAVGTGTLDWQERRV